MGGKVHQNQESKKPGDHICTTEREAKGDGRTQEAFPSGALGVLGPGCDGTSQCPGSLLSPSTGID